MTLVRFDPQQKVHLYAVTLHASIVQLSGGSLTLAKSVYPAGIPIVLRSMYEAIVDFDLLVGDATPCVRAERPRLGA